MEPVDPRALRPHYSAFLRPGRVLLTGHSHQAWPDAARAGQLEAFEAAAAHVDDKWASAFEAAGAVRASVASHLGVRPDSVALGASTHDLVVRLLSALPLAKKRHIVATAGEFHTLYRQLTRLAEEGVEVELVPTEPVATLAERLAAAARDDTAALFASTVLFESGAVVPHLADAAVAARARGAEVVLDAYHHFMVRPLSASDYAGGDVFVLGGGYKYAQWGEGACFMTVPASCALRPVVTGWFSDFAGLAAPRGAGPVGYGPTPADRFAGSTYDPTSHFRPRAVAAFFSAEGLTPRRLEESYIRQTTRIFEGLAGAGLTLVSPADARARGGFVAARLASPEAASAVVKALRDEGVWIDARGPVARLGPAPYVTDDELDLGVEAFVRHALAARS